MPVLIRDFSFEKVALDRSIGYAILVWKFYYDYKRQIENLLEDRKSMALEPIEIAMTESYCRIEFWLTVAHHLTCYCIAFIILHALVYFVPNIYYLPFNCYIFFLPLKFPFAWELNYLIITVATTYAAFFLALFIPLPCILMNQSCWLIDMASLTAQSMSHDLQIDEVIEDVGRLIKTNEALKTIAMRCEKFVEWQSEVQDLLSWYFNLEFQVQAIILCLCIYVCSYSFGILLVLLLFCAIQILVMCWMGTRVASRIDKLSFEISKNWYLMSPSQRKTAQMILHWTQNMAGFSGWFKDVSLETCKSVIEKQGICKFNQYYFHRFLKLRIHSTLFCDQLVMSRSKIDSCVVNKKNY